MPPTPALCPFCNATLPTAPAPPPSSKAPCPRCGEPVPADRWSIDPALATALIAGDAPVNQRRTVDAPAPEPGLGVRKTAFIVLGVMVTMLLIGMSFALWTTKLRQSRHPWMPDKLEPIAFRRPLELTGLQYLPNGSQLVVGIHVGELHDDRVVGQRLLAEPRPILLDRILKQIPRTTGLKLEQIDHVVLASSLDLQSPQLVMVVRTRQPYSNQTIAAALHPLKATLHKDQPLYEVSLKPLGEALLWCVEERTMIYVVRPLDTPTLEHLQGISGTPRLVDDVLAAPLRTTLTERLPKHNFLWMVGRLDQLGALNEGLPFLLGARVDGAAIKSLRMFALGVAPIEELTLAGSFQLANADAADKFANFLDGVRIEGAKEQKVVPPPARAQDPAAAPWVSWQVRGTVGSMRQLLNQGKEPKK